MTNAYISLFSGAGGLDLGLTRAGLAPALLCDENRAACDTLQAAFPRPATAMLTDIHDLLNAGTIPAVSRPAPVLVAGEPPLVGTAGTAPVVNPDGDVPQLLYRFMDAVGQARPDAFAMVSVAALNNSRWEAVMFRLRSTARELGYDTFTPVFDAADYGTAQHRERLVLVGMPKGCKPDASVAAKKQKLSAGAALSALPGGTRDIPCPSGVGLTGKPVVRSSAYSGQLLSGTGRMLDLSRTAPAVATGLGGNKTPVLDETQLEFGATPWIESYHQYLLGGGGPHTDLPPWVRMRRLSLRECAALQGFPPDYPFRGAAVSQFRLCGGAVPPGIGEAVGAGILAGLA